MAPALKILVQWLPSLPNTFKSPTQSTSSQIESNVLSSSDGTHLQQRPIGQIRPDHGEVHVQDSFSSPVSSVSWASNRVDAFVLQENNVTHKFWDGYQWNPSGTELEILGNGLATPPVALTWGPDRLDIFGLDDQSTIKHQYWDGIAWRPDVHKLENLGGGCADAKQYPVAASTWGPNRLDIFCRGSKGDLLHQYWDGSQWQPSAGSLESLGGRLSTAPSVISWGSDRLDIFALSTEGDVQHLYWTGSQWSGWETFPASVKFRSDTLTVTSWSVNRLDVYGISVDGTLWHKFWDGYQWASWELLGQPDTPLIGSVGATSWGPNRLDIVARSTTGQYWYKFYDGASWQPSVLGWYDKGSSKPFVGNPSVSSWSANRLDIFGENIDGSLLHQTWNGENWYPFSTGWECLGHCESNLLSA